MKRIEEVCRLSGVSRRTLQYYDNEGILSVKRSEENYRLYDETAMARLWEILWYKEMGFELKEIKNILTVTQKEKKQLSERKNSNHRRKNSRFRKTDKIYSIYRTVWHNSDSYK